MAVSDDKELIAPGWWELEGRIARHGGVWAVRRREGHVSFFDRVKDKISSIVYKSGELPVVSLSLSYFVVFFVSLFRFMFST